MQAHPGRHLVIPESRLPAKLAFPRRPMSDDEFYQFCMANPKLRFERTAEGEIIIVPPAGWESSYQSGDAFGQLRDWAKKNRRGVASDSSGEFVLPTGAALSPDAAWVSNRRSMRLSKDQRRKFPPLAPEFIIELMSPSDRLKDAKKKMEEWMRGGVELGWLIQADRKTVYIYRAGQPEPEKRTGIKKLKGEGPVAGFEMDLTDIWAGL
ncbi:MAG TPA: Uma2 family endonuclease [Bryobacteraceae bacterium]